MPASLQDLLDQSRHHPLLDAAGEVALGRRIAAGRRAAALLADRPEDPELLAAVADAAEARRTFLLANLRLVASVARRIPVPTGMDVDDLVQEGVIGLEHAVEKFDPERGYKFSTYATWWIRQAIGRAIDGGGSIIRIPTHRSSDLRARLRAVEGDPTRLDPALARLHELTRTVSLDQPAGPDEGESLGGLVAGDLPDPGHMVAARDESARLQRAMTVLDPRVRDAVTRRFGLDGDEPETYAQLARRLGVSPESARRLVQRALSRLRDQLDVTAA